jgi:hypothetical protein
MKQAFMPKGIIVVLEPDDFKSVEEILEIDRFKLIAGTFSKDDMAKFEELRNTGYPDTLNEDAKQAVKEASLVVLDGHIIKNRYGALPQANVDQNKEKRAAFVALMAGALSAKRLDSDEATGVIHPIDAPALLIEMLADTVEDMWEKMNEKKWI